MILTLVGTHEQPFDRLVREVDELPTGQQKIIQYGYSNYRPRHAVGHAFMEFDVVHQLMRVADVIITHAGTGSVMLALSLGRSPIVAPRYRKYGEHVDDHQLQLVELLEGKGLIIPFRDGESLAALVDRARSRRRPARRIESASALVEAIQEIVDSSRSAAHRTRR